MQAAQILAGYSLGAADLLRRAMGKKKASEMAAQRANFIAGALEKNGVPEDQAGMIFDQIDKFAGYGFNKSHAAAYALIAYQTAYLKANYPVEFFAAAMNFELGDTDKINMFRQELARNRIPLLPPDINRSFPQFAVEPQEAGPVAIRYALSAIKGVGAAAMSSMVVAREAGVFKDLFDFVERVDPRVVNRKQMENLANAGAFDGLNKNRAQVMAAVDILLKHSHQSHDERASGQSNMFGAAEKTARPALPPTKAWDDLARLKNEFGALGFYLSAHPLDNYKAVLERMGVTSASGVAGKHRATGPSRFKLAGIVVSKQERTSKNGNKFAFVQMSDAGGAFEITVFSELLAAQRDKLEAGQAVLVEVDAQTAQGGGESSGEMRYIARNVEPLAAAAERAAQGIRIKLYEPSPLAEIKKVLDAAPKGRGKVTLQLDLDDNEEAEMEIAGSWLLSEAMKAELRQIGSGLEVLEY